MVIKARLKAIATAVPPNRLPQDDAREGARQVFGPRLRDFERLAPVFANAGIAARYSAVPLDWYMEAHGWPEKNETYLNAALAVMEDAARRCMELAGVGLEEVEAIVTVSSTGIATPSLDARLMQRMGFNPRTRRLPVFGLGCAGGVLGLSRAATMAEVKPGRLVLLLVVELCTLCFRHDSLQTSNLVATALFGDGAAAALVCADDGTGAVLEASGEHTWPDTLDVMGWRVDQDGLGVIFSRDIPALIRNQMALATGDFLSEHGLTIGDLAGVVCHPGGAKVLDALSEVFADASAGLEDARAVLREFGNMSAPTVLFVLARRLASGSRGRHLMTALGPGFSAGFVLIDL